MKSLGSKNAAFALLLAFVLMMTVGGLFSAEMMMDDNGSTHNCPFMGMTAICTMSPLVHLSQWQQMFAATTSQLATILLLLLASVALTSFIYGLLVPRSPSAPIATKYREKEVIFNPLKLAFARGLIHPKVF